MNTSIIYQNINHKLTYKGILIVWQSKNSKSNDMYFNSVSEAYKFLGLK